MEESVVTRVKYRNLFPLAYLLIAAALASTVVFIYYGAAWHDDNSDEENDNFIRSRYGYYGAVISLLMALVFFNGYHLTV